MRDQTPLDAALIDVRQAFAEVTVVVDAFDHLRTRSDRLLPLLLIELRELRPKLDQVIALLEQDQEEGTR